ncbi:DUF5706 domain-containing protein [Actinoplanes sp. NBC_00393]|uniref:Pycsar system effector family protein n=1 Tax=Actinoplanes sp. NBC_00393 TaxID=2975953 RepID=UPI002E1B81E9
MATRKPPPPATDDAWRALQLQFDLVKHAETKAAATLASCGVLGGLLYSLVSQNKTGGVLFAVLASVTAVAIVTAATAAGLALRPRLFRRETGQNLLFYSAIAHRFGHDAEAFGREFSVLLADRPAMLAALSGQVLSNANVATRKYRATNVAIITLLVALGLMAATATIGLTGW